MEDLAFWVMEQRFLDVDVRYLGIYDERERMGIGQKELAEGEEEDGEGDLAGIW